MNQIDILNSQLDEAVQNGEITEREADIEYRVTLATWKNEAEEMLFN